MMFGRFVALTFVFSVLVGASQASFDGGEIVGPATVVEGDVLRVSSSGSVMTVRLAGIHAPFAAERCAVRRRSLVPCGELSAKELERLIGGRPVRCRVVDVLRNGVVSAHCSVPGREKTLNEEMIAAGWALANRPRGKSEWFLVQEEARWQRRGLWNMEFAQIGSARWALPRPANALPSLQDEPKKPGDP